MSLEDGEDENDPLASAEDKHARASYFRELLRLQGELVKLQDWVVATKQKVVILFEGRDAAGKGGVIKRITQRLNPRVCRVTALPAPKRLRGARYTPVAKRNDRPDGILYLLRNFPQLTDPQVGKLLGTTKDTIQKVRDRSHWNSANIKPRDPVILGLCSQSDLNAAVTSANERLAREGRAVPEPPPPEADEAA